MTKLKIDSSKMDPRVKSGQVAWAHIESEYRDVVDDIIDTLVPEGPYAYTLPWDYPKDDGIPHQRFVTDLPALRQSYEDLHRVSLVRDMKAIAEIRGDWYAFYYGLGEGLMKSTGDIMFTPTAVLFPTMGREGITGELIWRRSSRGPFFTDGKEGPLAAETAGLARQEAYIDCLRGADAEGAAKLHHPDAQIGVRDYIGDTGTIVGLHSADEYRRYLEQVFARFDVLDIQVVERLVSNWFVFAELLWVVAEKGGAGRELKFYTADVCEVLPTGLFASRIGHGTGPVSL